MKTIVLYQYLELSHATQNERAPSDARTRRRWTFEVRCEHIEGIEIRLRAVHYQARASARHKWTNEHAWFWSVNDCPDRRQLSDSYFVEKPGVPEWIVEKVIRIVRDQVRFESEET